MFDFINENVPEKIKTIFVINRFIHSYETRFSMVFPKPKAKISRFGLNTIHYHSLVYKEHNVTKEKHKKLLQMHFLVTSA